MVAVLVGLIVIALPITVISHHFLAIWKEKTAEDKYKRMTLGASAIDWVLWCLLGSRACLPSCLQATVRCLCFL